MRVRGSAHPCTDTKLKRGSGHAFVETSVGPQSSGAPCATCRANMAAQSWVLAEVPPSSPMRRNKHAKSNVECQVTFRIRLSTRVGRRLEVQAAIPLLRMLAVAAPRRMALSGLGRTLRAVPLPLRPVRSPQWRAVQSKRRPPVSKWPQMSSRTTEMLTRLSPKSQTTTP